MEIWIGGFGSEECGERGSNAFVKKYGEKGLLDDAHAVIPESMGAGDRITIISKERIHFAQHDIQLCNDVLDAYNDYVKELGVNPNLSQEELKERNVLPCKIQVLPFAASDAGRFSLAGYSATSFICFEGNLSKPSNWHNSEDTAENLEIPAMQTCFGTLKHFILNMEKKYNEK